MITFDKRLLNLELPGEQVILGDQRRLVVDSFTLFRITDPLLYYQSVGPVEDGIRGRLNSIVSASLRRVLANNKLLDVLSAKRDQIMATIRDQVNVEMKGFGVAIEDVRIRRADLPDENTKAILVAHAVGTPAGGRAGTRRGSGGVGADPRRRRTGSDRAAGRCARHLGPAARRGRGGGDAHLRQGVSAGCRLLRRYGARLQAYREAFETGNSRLVLTPDNEFLRYLQSLPVPDGQ